RRHHLVIAARIVREAVHQHYREARGGPGFLVGDFERRGAYALDHRLSGLLGESWRCPRGRHQAPKQASVEHIVISRDRNADAAGACARARHVAVARSREYDPTNAEEQSMTFIHRSAICLGAALTCVAATAAAQTIYPLNRAEILAGARF